MVTRLLFLVAALAAGGLQVRIPAQEPPFPLRGDADGDGSLAASDAVFILEYLFIRGKAPSCRPALDVNADLGIDISDGITLLIHLFAGGRAPPALRPLEVSECGGIPAAAIERGRRIYQTADAEAGKDYTCATCHAAVPDEQSAVLFAGHSLHDAVRRPSFKLGKIARFLDAANVCRTDWMLAPRWIETDADYQDLASYLGSIAPAGPAPALAYTIIKPSITGASSGSAEDGCRLFHRSCSTCHGNGGAGTALAPSLNVFPFTPSFLRAKIRLSGPRNGVYLGLTGGVMPFWALERLSDAQVEDLVAFLTSDPFPTCGP